MSTIINAKLPVIIEVLEKTSWWRYNLRFGTRTISTKSQVELEVGALYYANINTANGGVVSINGLTKRPNGGFISGGEQIIETVIETGDVSVAFEFFKNRLVLCDEANELDALCQSLIALNSGVLSVPFYYENYYCLAQLSPFGGGLDFYLLFSTYPEVLARIENGRICQVTTAYSSLSTALGGVLNCAFKTEKIEPLFKPAKNILDIKE